MGPATLALAVEGADPLSLWLQVILQLGALGVLILLAWQLPKAVSMLRQWRDESEKSHREERTIMREECKESLKGILEHFEHARQEMRADNHNFQAELENIQQVLEEKLGQPRRRKPPPGAQP